MVAPQRPTRGYFYLAWGADRFFDEAIVSARSLKRHTPGAHVTIAAADASPQVLTRLQREFDDVIEIPAAADETSGDAPWTIGINFKVRTLTDHAPYEQTFFVDTDTFFLESADPLFDLLEFFDLAIAPAPGDLAPARTNDGRAIVGFTPYNTGLIVFNRARVHELFVDWLRRHRAAYEEIEPGSRLSDQPAFASALLESDVRFAVIQTAWNARLVYPERLVGSVKMIHVRPNNLRGLSLEEAGKRVNRTSRLRVWVPKVNDVMTVNMGLLQWGRIIARGLPAMLEIELGRLRSRFGRN